MFAFHSPTFHGPKRLHSRVEKPIHPPTLLALSAVRSSSFPVYKESLLALAFTNTQHDNYKRSSDKDNYSHLYHPFCKEQCESMQTFRKTSAHSVVQLTLLRHIQIIAYYCIIVTASCNANCIKASKLKREAGGDGGKFCARHCTVLCCFTLSCTVLLRCVLL